MRYAFILVPYLCGCVGGSSLIDVGVTDAGTDAQADAQADVQVTDAQVIESEYNDSGMKYCNASRGYLCNQCPESCCAGCGCIRPSYPHSCYSPY